MRRELPRKQVTNISGPSIIHTPPSMPQPLQELQSHIRSNKPGRMRAALGPVNPSQRPVRVGLPEPDADQRGQVVLVAVTRRAAILVERREVSAVGDDVGGEGSVYLEPLRALSPLREADQRPHSGGVSATAHRAWGIVGFHEGVG